jgi:hypothetical protein
LKRIFCLTFIFAISCNFLFSNNQTVDILIDGFSDYISISEDNSGIFEQTETKNSKYITYEFKNTILSIKFNIYKDTIAGQKVGMHNLIIEFYNHPKISNIIYYSENVTFFLDHDEIDYLGGRFWGKLRSEDGILLQITSGFYRIK